MYYLGLRSTFTMYTRRTRINYIYKTFIKVYIDAYTVYNFDNHKRTSQPYACSRNEKLQSKKKGSLFIIFFKCLPKSRNMVTMPFKRCHNRIKLLIWCRVRHLKHQHCHHPAQELATHMDQTDAAPQE
jgi:hypothetical protein